MTCEKTKNQILLEDTARLSAEVSTHLKQCESCRDFQQIVTQSKKIFLPADQPSEALVDQIKNEAQRLAPSRSLKIWRRLRPTLAMAASFAILLGFVLTNTPQTEGISGLTLNETDLLNSQDQLLNVTTESFSEDDLAFNFMMTDDDIL